MRAAALVLAMILTGCATPNFTGPSTIRCASGLEVRSWPDGGESVTCETGFVVTGALSSNAKAALIAIAGAITGFLAGGL